MEQERLTEKAQRRALDLRFEGTDLAIVASRKFLALELARRAESKVFDHE